VRTRRARHNPEVRIAVLALAVTLAVAAAARARPIDGPLPPAPTPGATPADFAAVHWHHSRALGEPFWHGRLVHGTQLPAAGPDFFTWDPVYNRIPDRGWRRWGTDRLIRVLLTVIAGYRAAAGSVARIGIMDLSRRHGGPFGRDFGGLGHASHQNGLDADVLYPRTDGLEARATVPGQVDQHAAQELIDRFVAAGAVKVFVGPHLHHLHGPENVVIPLLHHNDHMHVRIR
jgi:murein endopeptidase